MSQPPNNPLTNLQRPPSAPVRLPRSARKQRSPQPTYHEPTQDTAQPIYEPTQASSAKINQRAKLEPANQEYKIITRGIKPMTYFDDIMLSPTHPKHISQRNKLS